MWKRAFLGYGVTGRGVAREGGWIFVDDRFQNPSYDQYRNLLLPPRLFHPEEVEYIITSPGFPPNHPLIQRCQGKLVGELDHFWTQLETPPFQIWVTGTNGKSTTTEMIGALLPEGEVGGNIGVPLGELDPSAPIWILEVSSFQLHYTHRATPAILLLLPITQDHLDWHGSFENYLKAKLSPIGRMGERGVVIYPAELEREVRAHLPPAPPFLIPYTDPAQLATSFQLTPPIFQPPFDLDEVLARLVRKILHWDDPGLEGFQVAPHKVEEFRDRFGRLWVDDSKATNVDAVIGAVNRYRDRKIHLILGGVGKGQNFTPLFQQLKRLNLELYLIGETQRELGELAQKFQIGAHLVGTLERAVHQIGKELKKGEVALLSPGCASFDQFKSYRERGEQFKELVLGL